ASAISLPRPREPPVTMAVRPVRSKSSLTCFVIRERIYQKEGREGKGRLVSVRARDGEMVRRDETGWNGKGQFEKIELWQKLNGSSHFCGTSLLTRTGLAGSRTSRTRTWS